MSKSDESRSGPSGSSKKSRLRSSFQNEILADARQKENFVENNIPHAPPLTGDEKNIIEESMKLVEDVASRAKRIAGTVNDSVEKFLYRAEGEARVWVLAVAKLDIAPVNFFTELWLLDTYAKKAENKKLAVHKVIKDLDGTRGVQYTRSVSLPGGFKDRLFESWITFEERVEADGRRTYIIAWCPLEKYKGTHHRVDGAEMLQKATTRGVYIVRELTDNTCEWTWAQQVDMKIALPARALVMYATKSLARANKLQDMFRRNGKAVDRERVEALATIMQGRRGMPPMADQAGVFERCLELLREGGEPSEKGWKNLESPSQEVEMKMKYFPSKYGERSVGTGKAVGVVDCSAEEFAAWVMDFLSNTRVRISKEFNNPARIEMRKLRRENEGSFATVKKLPSFLDNREFVFRQIWRAEEGKATVVFESIDDKVDYGVTFRKKTQGHIKGFYAIEDLPLRGGAKQCRVTLVQKIDVGGSIPTWVADKKMTTYLGVVHEAFDYFRQDNRIDAADRGELSALIVERGNEQVYSEEENAMLQRVSQKFDGSLEEGKWTKLKSPDVFVRMESVFEKGSSAGVGRAVTVVDASLEDCAAWELMKMSREAMKDHHEWGGLDRKVVELTEHSSLYYVAYDLGVASLAAREWLCARVWKKVDENSMICCYEDAEDENFPPGAGKKYARASSNAFWKYERLHEVKGIPQTRVTYSLQADLKGLIPVFIANFKITSTLAALSTMRKKFEKSVEVDASNRAVIAQKIKEKGESGGAEALAKFEALYRERTGWQRPSRSFGKVDCKLLSELVSAKTWGSNSLQIRGGLHDIAAFIWDFGSRANMEISRDVERSFEKEVGDRPRYGLQQQRQHHEEPVRDLDVEIFKQTVRRRQHVESSHVGVHRDRSFTSEMSLHVVSDGELVILLQHIEAEAEGTESKQNVSRVSSRSRVRDSISHGSDGSIEAKENVGIRLKDLGGGRTKLEFACELELGFGISLGTRLSFLQRRLEETVDLAIYFQRLVPLEAFSSEDGRVLAYDILWTANSRKKRLERMKEVVEKSSALRELCSRYSCIQLMLSAALKANLSRNRPVGSKLVCVSDKEAIQIGNNLVPSLMTEQLAESGVDQWRIQNRAVKELMEKQVWFEPMVVVLGQGIVKTAAWGLMFRVIVGAVLSVTDLASDLFVLKQFWNGGKEMLVFRNATFASLTMSMGLQVLWVLIQYRKTELRRQTREILVVLTGMKAAADAYRVAMGAEKEKNTEIDPMTEMTFTKCVETFAESLPGVIIQLSAIISAINGGGEVTTAAYMSLGVSILTTGFISATISYDFDTDPKKRAFNPEFYGYAPDNSKKRAVLFVALTLLSATQILIKASLVIVLGKCGSGYPLHYLLGDVAFYLLYKLARRDFTYWLPVYGVTGVLLSGIIRIIIKLIVDFAAIVHFRHPYELGGLFWSINMFLPLLGLVAVIASDLPKGIFSEATLELFTSYIMVLGFSLLSFLSLFLLLMNKEYRHTFFSMETGAHLTRSAFTDGEDDFEKSYLIGCNEDQWKLFIGDEVEAWVKENWTTWEGEKPDWFTDQWISNVPREMIPKKMIDKEKSSTAKVTESRRTNRISKISKVAPEGLEEREEHLDEELLVMENQQTASFDV
ncbi:hypothetical protein TrST_g565 [Triparma strigata]|uniref:START domain-containing protein n=1 Tax=Triparma strigata TaxID=1606541 RepID=A0A9W7BKC7_9STRA|nr:hypothetical protein TrST_g565 [Triparma strigata]